MKIINITSSSDLSLAKTLAPDELYQIKIDIPEFTPKQIVNFVLKNKDKCDILIRTSELSCISNNKWLLFKRHGGGIYQGKRGLDLMFGAFFFTISLPIFLVGSILVKLSSKGGPVIFRQPRTDNKLRTFNLYKFRTMRLNGGEETHQNYMKKVINGRNLAIDGVYKLTDDPRTTGIGKWFRRFSLDELPQLINVLKGEMSLVGPRPPIPYEVESYKEWHFARFHAKPGLTGLWQVMGRSLIPFDEMVVLDLYYAFNQSFWLDVKILLRTIPMVLSLRGAF